MIQKPMDVLEGYQVRKSKKQKTAFLTDASAYAASLRYPSKIEMGSFGTRNLVIGDPEKARYLITAHYDTCAWLPLPNFITPFNIVLYMLYQFVIYLVCAIVATAAVMLIGTVRWLAAEQTSELLSIFGGILSEWYYWGFIGLWIFAMFSMLGPANRRTANDNTSGVVTVLEIIATLPENLRDKVCFVLFDLEEAGLLGSSAYRKAHKAATNRQTVINLDCVGEGDEIFLIPGKQVRKDAALMDKLSALDGTWGRKSLKLHEKGFVFYPSDQASFPKGIAVAAFCRSRWVGSYLSRIHTHRDTVLDYTNVNILRAALISLICRDA